MSGTEAEYFTDPLSPWCWAAQPTVRRLRFTFEDLEWTPRMAVLLPDTGRADALPDGIADADELREAWTGVLEGAAMPVADDLWPDGPPASSRPACEAVAFVREATPDRVDGFLRRLREAAFVEGRPVGTPAALVDLAAAVDGVDGAALERALADGRAAAALEADLDRARRVADEVAAGIRTAGTIELAPAAPRGRGAADDRDREEGGDGENASDAVVAPPAIRFERREGAVVANPRVAYQELAAILGRSLARISGRTFDKYGTERMAIHVPRRMAEQLTSDDYTPEVRAYMERFGRAFVPEVAAGTGRTPDTCRRALEALADAGVVAPLPAGGWRYVGRAQRQD